MSYRQEFKEFGQDFYKEICLARKGSLEVHADAIQAGDGNTIEMNVDSSFKGRVNVAQGGNNNTFILYLLKDNRVGRLDYTSTGHVQATAVLHSDDPAFQELAENATNLNIEEINEMPALKDNDVSINEIKRGSLVISFIYKVNDTLEKTLDKIFRCIFKKEKTEEVFKKHSRENVTVFGYIYNPQEYYLDYALVIKFSPESNITKAINNGVFPNILTTVLENNRSRGLYVPKRLKITVDINGMREFSSTTSDRDVPRELQTETNSKFGQDFDVIDAVSLFNSRCHRFNFLRNTGRKHRLPLLLTPGSLCKTLPVYPATTYTVHKSPENPNNSTCSNINSRPAVKLKYRLRLPGSNLKTDELFGYTPNNLNTNITLYTSIAPHTTDYFVSAESYQRTVVNEPKILHSLVSSKVKGEKGDLLKVVEICWSRMSGHKSFLPLPEELSNHLFTGDKQLANVIIQYLNISERSLLELTETYVQRHVTDIVFHHTKRKTLPKKTDHSYWSICQGRINKCEASIAIRVPGISMSSLQGIKEEYKIKNSMLENDFKILLGLQKDETHINVVRLLAYSDLKYSLHFYVKDNHRIEILEKLLEVRGQKTRFSGLWLNNRLIEMISALNYLHGKKIIHRDVTLRCFHLAHFSETEEDETVLYDLNLASQTGFSMTASCQVEDMQGDGIPIRWSAVESILLNCYDARSDIWMFGHVIHELFTYGCEPFTDQYSSTTDDIISGVLSGDISPYRWPCIPYDYHKLALSCWKTDPKDRPSAEEILKHLRRLRDKRVVGASEETPDLPRLSESQQERGHEPERGISPFIRKLKEKSLEKKENIRKTVIEMRRQSMPNPRSPLKEPVLCLDDIKPLHDPVVEETGEHLRIAEQVSVQFCEKILPTMSPDFCEKMGIIADTLSREKGNISGKGIDNILKYMYPKAVNILKLLKGNVSHHSSAKMLLAVARLVQRMHAKRWLMVALIAKNIYIQHQENQYRAFLVKLGTMVRLPETPDINQGSIRVSDRFEDMIFWIPREVISFGELSTGSDILGVLNEGQKPEKPEKCPGWLYDDVMIPCWHSDRSCRPSACDIVEIMTKRISENQDITSSSLKTDKRSFNNRDDTSPERITEEQNLDGGYLDAIDTGKQQCCGYDMLGQTAEDQYDDIANTNSTTENSFSSRMVEIFSRSFTLNEKEMAQFEMDCQPSVPSTSTSSFISPNTNDTNLEIPIFRPTEPQPFRDKSQAFGVMNPESHNSKSNPLFQSFQSSVEYSASTSTDGIRKEEPENKIPCDVLTNPNSDSVNKSSDFSSSESK
ncbi:uncharacterized protein LOC133196963 [Saccostrea echinata]|uniref:uncharacterized protein LOC133196963 n=1 Tax=Saccostrea echinata TaxID=191078 RepID=UPI002A7FD5EF|nr:uncharacterized protein LOC133196963 [Saccostrea echinata]